MSTLVQHARPQARAGSRAGKLQRLVRKHEDLERRIVAYRSHGLSTAELWLAMISLEDRLRAESPRAYTHWLAVWLVRRDTGAHAIGAVDPECSLCRRDTARPTRKRGSGTGVTP